MFDRILAICDKNFEQAEIYTNIKKNLQELKEEKTDYQARLTVAKSENKSLQNKVENITPEYNETLKEKMEAADRLKIPMHEVEKLENNINSIQQIKESKVKTKSQLETQLFSDEEYNKLKELRKTLEDEKQDLNEAYKSSFTRKFKLQESVSCLQEYLHQLSTYVKQDDSSGIFKLFNLREKLNTEGKHTEFLTKQITGNEIEKNEAIFRFEKEKTNFDVTKKDTNEWIRKETEYILLEKTKCTKTFKEAFNKNQQQIEELEKLLKQNENMEKESWKFYLDTNREMQIIMKNTCTKHKD